MSVLDSVLLWLDATPARYWGAAYAALSLVGISAGLAYLAPRRTSRWNPPWLFALLLLGAAFVFRWPLIFDNRQFDNPDESYILAGANVLKSSPVFWQSVDGATHGPLVEWPLAAMGALGVRMDYTNARIFALFLVWSSVLTTWLTLRSRLGEGLSRLLILPMALFFITTQYWDFVQYSSEHVPLALLSAAAWLILSATWPAQRAALWTLFFGGLLLGAVPFAKLQATPIGLWIGASALTLILADRSITLDRRFRLAGRLVAGALVVPCGIFLMIHWHHLWTDFWIAYYKANVAYAQAFPLEWNSAPAHFQKMAKLADQFREYFYPAGGILLAALLGRLFLGRRSDLPLLAFAAGLFVVSLFAIVAPNRPFLHYLQFAVAPTALLSGLLVGGIVRRVETATWFAGARWLTLPVLGLFLWFGTADLFGFLRLIAAPHAGQFTAQRGRLVRSPTAEFVHAITRPDDSVAIWGWEPAVLVEARRRNATREPESSRELFDSDQRPFYRARYLADLSRAKPAVFVDVTGPGTFFFEDRARYGHETFPALAQYIATHYRLLALMGHSRVYLRNDRPFVPPPP